MLPPAFAPGDRVRVGGVGATVRYVGPLTHDRGGGGAAPGDAWVGLEWDAPDRGRHGGAVGGVRYFSVRPGAPTAGSLVRHAALAHAAERGVSLTAALAKRYGGGGGGGGSVVGGDAVARRQARLDELEVASVAGMPMALTTPACRFPVLTDLDASRTLLAGWPALAALAAAAPSLARLDVSAVPLHVAPPPPRPPPHAPPCFAALRTLVLAETGATWRDAVAVAAHAPRLAALSLRGCGLAAMDGAAAAGAMAALTELDVSSNPALGWGAVEAGAGALPALARLDVARCAAVAALAPRGPPAASFTALTSLNLDGTGLADWAWLPALASFRALAAVRVAGVQLPPPSPSAGDARADVVARLPPTVVHLNGAPVSAFERRDAARALAAAAAAAAAGPPPPPKPLAMVALDVVAAVDAPPVKSVRVPLATPWGRVRALAARVMGVGGGGGATVALCRRRGGGDGACVVEVVERGDDGRDLAYLGVEDGDRLVVTAE